MQMVLRDGNGLWRENVTGELIIVDYATNLEDDYLLLRESLQIDKFIYLFMWHEKKPLLMP